MADTVCCLLCRGVVLFTEKDQTRYETHLSIEHKVFYHIPWLIRETLQQNGNKTDVKMSSVCPKMNPSLSVIPISKSSAFRKAYKASVSPTPNTSVSPFLKAVGKVGESQNVSVSITKVISGEELSMEEAQEDAKKEVNYVLDNMNPEELMVEDENEDTSDSLLEDKNDSISGKMKDKKMECTLCNKHFSSRRNLKRHTDNRHGRNPENPKLYQCTVCKKSFKTKSYVEVHEKKHTSQTSSVETVDIQEEEFQCDSCPKVFRTEFYMKTHQKSHTLA